MTEEDRAATEAVDWTCLFNEAQQAQLKASVLYHSMFLRIKDQMETEREGRRVLEEKLLESRTGLDLLNKEHASCAIRLEEAKKELGYKLRGVQAELNRVKAELDESRAELDENKAELEARVQQLESEKTSLRKEVANLTLANEARVLEIELWTNRFQEAEAKVSQAEETANDLVAQYRADADAANQQSRMFAEYAKWFYKTVPE
ncbi:PREDICTED: uncharacterized protein LOC109238433 [Nicotiana attenuata]|uniref:uncharacterized protein LOC109238433 n=1 Tax=Nicotiana attenuata TaxID=49451 RepID=UPI000904DD67|nr:PREDICTED: uncharacterized protein LOC109238433 [Nicotiana attenuata]